MFKTLPYGSVFFVLNLHLENLVEIGVKNQFSYQYKSKRHQYFTGVFFDIKHFINKYRLHEHVYIEYQL